MVITLLPGMKAEAATVKLNKTKATIYAGKTVTLKLKNASKVIWKSSNTKIAKVSSKGVVTGIGKGTATITATNKTTKKQYKCKVTVKLNKFGFDEELFYLYENCFCYEKNVNSLLNGATVTCNGVTVKCTSDTMSNNGDGNTWIHFPEVFEEGALEIEISKKNYETYKFTFNNEHQESLFDSEDCYEVKDGMLYVYLKPETVGKEIWVYFFGVNDGVAFIPTQEDVKDGYVVYTYDISSVKPDEYEVRFFVDGFEPVSIFVMIE